MGCWLARTEALVVHDARRRTVCGVQQRVQERDPRIRKEPEDTNVSDALIRKLLTSMECEVKEGRTTLAPK